MDQGLNSDIWHVERYLVRSHLRPAAIAVAACLCLVAPVAGAEPRSTRGNGKVPPGAGARADALGRALANGEITPAQHALERARAIFNRAEVESRYGEVAPADPREATDTLRTLALSLSRLSPSEKKTAQQVLGRPSGGYNPFSGVSYGDAPRKRKCRRDMPLCFHWTKRGQHAPPQRDANGNGRPDWVDKTIATFVKVWDVEIRDLGYRKPKPDGRSQVNGGNNKTDIYLANVGKDSLGLYGYCTTDDPNASRVGTADYPYWDVSAYCVLDNDFSQAEFPNLTPLKNLRVTAAHEFFHAVQFAYDFGEDAWLLEGTATAMEDEVFDAINDNYQYLTKSPLTQPHVPVDYSSYDTSSPKFGHRYGAWLFWRFMTEYLGTGGSRAPGVIKAVWGHADASRQAAHGDQYSLQAAVSVANERLRAKNFRDLYSDFGVSNFIAEEAYEEGQAYLRYLGGGPPLQASEVVSGTDPATGQMSTILDHLTHRYVRFRRGAGVSPSDTLQVKVDAPALRTGSRAKILTFVNSGLGERATVDTIQLNENGDGTISVPFGTSTKVVLVLTNASTRIERCYEQWDYSVSCSGFPQDDNLQFSYQATLQQQP